MTGGSRKLLLHLAFWPALVWVAHAISAMLERGHPQGAVEWLALAALPLLLYVFVRHLSVFACGDAHCRVGRPPQGGGP